MVTALAPIDFLDGKTGCGQPLVDVELDIHENGALKIRTPRLAISQWKNGEVQALRDKEGWWCSGDKAVLTNDGSRQQLKIIGRIDNAINCGGETIFPERLEAKFIAAAKNAKLPIEYILVLLFR